MAPRRVLTGMSSFDLTPPAKPDERGAGADQGPEAKGPRTAPSERDTSQGSAVGLSPVSLRPSHPTGSGLATARPAFKAYAAAVSSTCSPPSGVSTRRPEAPVMVRSPATGCDLGQRPVDLAAALSNLVMPLLKRRARHGLGGDIMFGIRRRKCRNPRVEPIRFLPVEETSFQEQIRNPKS